MHNTIADDDDDDDDMRDPFNNPSHLKHLATLSYFVSYSCQSLNTLKVL